MKGIVINVRHLDGLLQGHDKALKQGTLTPTEEFQLRILLAEATALLGSTVRFLDKVTTTAESGRREVKKARWLMYISEARDLQQDFTSFFQVHSAVHDSLILCVLSQDPLYVAMLIASAV